MLSANPTRATPAAVPTNASQSLAGRPGSEGNGTLASISPTTAMPWSSSPNTHVTTSARTTPTSVPGTFGTNRLRTRISTNVPTPITVVAPWASSRLPKKSPSRSRKCSLGTGTPVSLLSWLTNRVRPRPAR